MVQRKTKRQHYVQREYIKNFCINNTDSVNAYNICAGNEKKLKPTSLCVIKEMYEISGNLDNRIENHLKEFEDKGIQQIKKIVDFESINGDIFTNEDLKSLYQYVFLQLIRTKSGQLVFQSIKENLDLKFSKPSKHVSNSELYKNSEIINRNIKWIHDNMNEFDDVIDSLWIAFHDSMRFGLYVSEQPLLITSDCPIDTDVIPGIYNPCMCYLKMALTPRILLDIEIVMNDSMKVCNFFKCELTNDIAFDFNEKIISNANYWVMSSNEFSNLQRKILIEQHTRMTKV